MVACVRPAGFLAARPRRAACADQSQSGPVIQGRPELRPSPSPHNMTSRGGPGWEAAPRAIAAQGGKLAGGPTVHGAVLVAASCSPNAPGDRLLTRGTGCTRRPAACPGPAGTRSSRGSPRPRPRRRPVRVPRRRPPARRQRCSQISPDWNRGQAAASRTSQAMTVIQIRTWPARPAGAARRRAARRPRPRARAACAHAVQPVCEATPRARRASS